MTPQERKESFDKLEDPKPTWETFKRMLSMLDGDVDSVMKKWRKKVNNTKK
jgi:hypothetical protein